MKLKETDYLPLGTIVQLKNGDSKLIIDNRLPLVANEKRIELYDYMASIFPIGINIEHSYYFNNDDIDKVFFKGYVNDVELNFQNDLKKWLNENEENFVKGKTRLLKKNVDEQ